MNTCQLCGAALDAAWKAFCDPCILGEARKHPMSSPPRPDTPGPFLSLETKQRDGTTRVVQMDEAGARDALTVMESWGDDLGEDMRALREALRTHFNHAPLRHE